VFAQRNKRRPDRTGVCTCELVAVDGAVLTVRGLDSIDGTPVLDIKPHDGVRASVRGAPAPMVARADERLLVTSTSTG
jgi:tRNA (Thr-GGU) A37 N-methylase